MNVNFGKKFVLGDTQLAFSRNVGCIVNVSSGKKFMLGKYVPYVFSIEFILLFICKEFIFKTVVRFEF